MGRVMSTKEVAEFVGASEPSVVSNWRKRYDNFPKPVPTDRATVCYNIDEVIDWLEARGVRMVVETTEQHAQFIGELRWKLSRSNNEQV